MSCEIQPARHNHQPTHQQGIEEAFMAWPKLTKNASFGPNLAVFGPEIQFFWGHGVKILVPSYQDSNETPFSCWKHIHIHISWIGTSLIHASWTHSYCTHLHVTHCLSARNSNWCRSTLVPRILSQLLCEYLFYVNQLSGKIFDIGHLTLGLVLLSSPLKGRDSLAVGSNW